jgi:hypothetical protein
MRHARIMGRRAHPNLARLEFYRLRFHFLPLGTIHFPAGKSANVLRGALGTVFRQIACTADCPGTRECADRQSCVYARIFEPAAPGTGPSGFSDWPRPFVFRARHLDGVTVECGDPFSFDLHVFTLDSQVLEYFVRSFREIGRRGLGPGRGRAHLRQVDQLDIDDSALHCVYDSQHDVLSQPEAPTRLALDPPSTAWTRVRVDFLTPTELKAGDRIIANPAFGILFARIRDRISTLCALYGNGPLRIDFKAAAERAAQVRTVRCDLQNCKVERRSSRTGQTHPIGGFIGAVEYEGDLTGFVPYLEAARWTGVGRQTTWGKGEIALSRDT